MDLKNYEYYEKLQNLIKRNAGINDFIVLYRQYFNDFPTEEMLEAYIKKVNNISDDNSVKEKKEPVLEEDPDDESYDWLYTK